MQRIIISTIDHEAQRYDTVGDWICPNSQMLVIHVSRLGDWRMEALVAVHELVEAILCKHRGVTYQAVDRFDADFSTLKPQDEPGDATYAPYRDEHCFATAVERMLCAAMGLSWTEYEEKVNAL